MKSNRQSKENRSCEPCRLEALERRALLSAVTLQPNEVGRFGTVDGGAGVALLLTDGAHGDATVKFSLRGGGTGLVMQTETGFDVTIDDSSPGTSVQIISSNGTAVLSDVTIHGPLGAFRAGSVNLAGTFAAGGAIRTLALGDVSAAKLRLEGTGVPTRLTLANVSETSIESAGAMKSLHAAQWTDVDETRDVIIAPSIDTVQIGGDFSADLTLTDASADLSLRRLEVGGSLIGAQVRAASDMLKVLCAALRDSLVLAGVTADVDGRVSAADQFQTRSRIGSFAATGSADGVTLDRSSVAAFAIGKVRIGAIATPHDGALSLPFGITAGRVDDYRRDDTATGRTIKIKDAAQQGLQDAEQRYRLEIV